MVSVEIDPGSGFCGGVIRAITRAEEYLSTHSRMYSLGDIVHNEAELSRLEQRGLITVKSLSEVPRRRPGASWKSLTAPARWCCNCKNASAKPMPRCTQKACMGR